MTCEPKEKYCKSSLKHNQIFLYFIVKFDDLCLTAILTRTSTRESRPATFRHTRSPQPFVNKPQSHYVRGHRLLLINVRC